MEQTIVVVCVNIGTKTPFDDNVRTQCATCGIGVLHRPQVPEPSLKLCFDCAEAEMRVEQKMGRPVSVCATPEQMEEVDRLHGPGATKRALGMLRKRMGL